MKALLKLRVLIPLLYLFVIISSYILHVLISDAEYKSIIMHDSQKYVIENSTSNDVLKSLVSLSKTDSNYSSFLSHISQIEGNEHNMEICHSGEDESWIMQFYLNKYDIEFTFNINRRSQNSIELLSYKLSNEEQRLLYKPKVFPIKCIEIQNIFETEILDKVCEYDKCYMLGLAIWYDSVFWEYQLVFHALYWFLAFASLGYSFYKIRRWREFVVFLSLLLYVPSYYFPFVINTGSPYFSNYILPTMISSFTFDNIFKSIIFITNIIYILSLIFYTIGMKIKYIVGSIILIIMLALYLPIANPSGNAFMSNTPLATRYDVGYYFWLSSMLLLFIGMMFVNKLSKKN